MRIASFAHAGTEIHMKMASIHEYPIWLQLFSRHARTPIGLGPMPTPGTRSACVHCRSAGNYDSIIPCPSFCRFVTLHPARYPRSVDRANPGKQVNKACPSGPLQVASGKTERRLKLGSGRTRFSGAWFRVGTKPTRFISKKTFRALSFFFVSQGSGIPHPSSTPDRIN